MILFNKNLINKTPFYGIMEPFNERSFLLMESSIAFMIALQVILIALNAIFACAEIAIISMNDNKLAKMAGDDDKRAIRLQKLTNQPARFLATIQVAITLSGFMGSAFAAGNFSGLLVNALVKIGVPIPVSVLESISVVLITIILSFFTLVFGELVPKQIGMRKSESLALGMSGLISGISKAFSPIVWLLTVSTNGLLKLVGIDPNAEDDNVSEEEIRMMVDVGSEKGTIDHEEKEFIQNVFEFDDLSVEDIMTHRVDVIMLDIQDSMEEWKKIIYESRHNKYPVYDNSADKIVGILEAKEYFRLEDQSRESVMEYAVKPAYFVPDFIKADVLFGNMKKERHSFAVVMDEYGGMSGIVSISDLVEQLVGDLGEVNGEEEEDYIELLEEGVYKVHGSTMLSDIDEVTGLSLDNEDYDTFNGLIFNVLGCVPEDGKDIEVEVAGMKVKVVEIKEHQIESAIITIQK